MLLAVPMVLEMLMESVFAVADVFFVGRLGADAVATVGITESLMTIIYAVAMGLSVGAAATVARRIGERDRDGAARAAGQSILFALVIGLFVGAAGIVFAPELLGLMGASDDVIRTGSQFARVMIGASSGVTLLFLINAVFRGAGDAAIAMRVLWIANAVNIILGPCLIFGLGPFPRLGVTGAAIGTSIGRWTGVFIQIYCLTRPDGRIVLRWSDLRLDTARDERDPAHLGLGDVSEFHRHGVVHGPGADHRRVRQRGGRGQHHRHPHHPVRAAAVLGRQQRRRDAGRPESRRRKARSRGGVRVAGRPVQHRLPRDRSAWCFCCLRRPSSASSRATRSWRRTASQCLRIVSAGFLFYGYGMVLTSAFNGAGDTRTPTLINLFSLWLLEIPLAWFLAYPAGFGPAGAFIAMSIGFSTLAFISAWIFSKGHWKTRRV